MIGKNGIIINCCNCQNHPPTTATTPSLSNKSKRLIKRKRNCGILTSIMLFLPPQRIPILQRIPRGNERQRKATPTTVEEATKRFAKIAQAYQVLSDPEQRKEYNLFLEYCKHQQLDFDHQNGIPHHQHWKSFFSQWRSVDPLKLFEDFFSFGTKDHDFHDHDNGDHHHDNLFYSSRDFHNDMHQEYYHQYQQHKEQKQQNSKPIKITKHQDRLHDHITGEEFIRMSQTEEYATDPQTGKFYYRILSQDFVKRFDPYSGVTMVPITNPYLREEGYRLDNHRRDQYSNKKQESSAPTQSLLFPGDILTTNSALLRSPNGRFYAGLTDDCEFIIMADNSHKDHDLIWSSETVGKHCFVTLRGPHLTVAMGRPDRPHEILWSSPASPQEDDENLYSHSSKYVAELDNDGSLAIYRVWTVPRHAQTLAARALITARQYAMGHSYANYDYLYSPFTTTYKRCVYATGPLGCVRVARRAHQWSMNFYYLIQHIWAKMDATMDAWMDVVLEEDLDLRSLARRSSKLAKKLLEFLLEVASKR